MKQKILLLSIAVFTTLVIGSLFLNKDILENLRNTFTVISGTASFITVVIAILLFNKYGIDKTIKDKNLEISLKLLEEIKSIRIIITSDDFGCYYQPTVVPIEQYEFAYKAKLLFSKTYANDLQFLRKYSTNLYLPLEIKKKLDILIPSAMGRIQELIKESDYALVTINGNESEGTYNWINSVEEITVFKYLIMWDELITTVKNWCVRNSDSKIDLNIN
jgi:hypothetical protein